MKMEKLLTSRQAADILGIDIRLLFQWTHRGVIPHYKISKRMIRFRESELTAWLQGKCGETQNRSVSSPARQNRKENIRICNIKDESILKLINVAKKEVLGE